jgi:esterase/lipase
MDFAFISTLGYVGGDAFGECFAAAAKIKDGDIISWANTWQQLGEKMESSADKSCEGGHKVSAREMYWRAFSYYWAAERALPRPEAFNIWLRARQCFQKAAVLFDPPIKTLEIPFENGVLTGYFVRPVHSNGNPLPTIIMIGGAETTAEGLWAFAGEAAQKRNYNTLLIDLPGQGGAVRLHGLTFRPDTEVPVAVIMDVLLQRNDVDPERIAIHGLSAGGYFAPRAAVYEHRIKACIANCPFVNLGESITGMLPDTDEQTLQALVQHLDPFTRYNIERVIWAAGCTSITETLQKWREFSFEGHENEIQCPVLCLVSTGDGEQSISNAKKFYEKLTTKKQFILLTPEDGADAHCQLNNISIQQQIVFDWLDDIFK